MIKNLSTRSRVALLVIMSALPALALSIYNGLERRAQAEINAREDLKRFAKLAAERQEETLEGARQLLFATATTAESLLKDPQSCNEFFRKLVLNSQGQYYSMGVHLANGDMYCDAVTWQGQQNMSGRLYFKLAAGTGKFATGEYQVGHLTGLPGINFGYPVLDAKKQLVAVVFAALDLRRLNTLAATTLLPRDGVLTIFDRNGTILAQHPNFRGKVGEKWRNGRVLQAILETRDGMLEAPDVTGVRRLYAFESVGENPDGSVPIHVAVSIPTRTIFAEADRALFQTVAGILVATLLLLLGAWYGTGVMVLRTIENLLGMAQRVSGGDYAARTTIPPGQEELSKLGNALNDMAQTLQERDAALKRVLAELSEQATTDPLTGLHNRRYLWDFLQRDLLRARRAELPVAAILFDIDHFKRFNDTWGHEAGDAVLKAAAEIVKQDVRGSDIACRYGGEEFVVVLAEATQQVAIERAERIRHDIEKMKVSWSGRALESVTASFGIALYPRHAQDQEALMRAADEALYEAKNSGRNRVVVYKPKTQSVF